MGIFKKIDEHHATCVACNVVELSSNEMVTVAQVNLWHLINNEHPHTNVGPVHKKSVVFEVKSVIVGSPVVEVHVKAASHEHSRVFLTPRVCHLESEWVQEKDSPSLVQHGVVYHCAIV